ncbi:Thioredoxin reductase [Variovorax sp. PBS-H4]|uniref:NAD(P)/FAD-dependent oxidoreductase n=1 Tax=Variovorax sp. PBS-H4 TaxID=434008 RepID=UPI0013170BC0|nr:NAD(P)/FAD-dependent oxidoreductase [Variovorax sp. PBS-H4]VTU27956.1 Thioredoxin reductase [Variovorax sp. PBS-H4]
MTFDVAIVGGSFAGLSAALQLARARRRVAIFDTGVRRNRFAASAHGFFAQDGRAPGAIVAEARAQVGAYATVRWFESHVSSITGGPEAFALQVDGGAHEARRVVLATGVADGLPSVPGLEERWGRSVFHCPYCHGYELALGRIGVIATGPNSLHQALLLPEWGSVTFFLNGALVPSDEDARALAARGVVVEPTPIARIAERARVLLVDGRNEDFAGLFTATRTEPASELAAQLGCVHEQGPLGAFVKTGPMKETSVPGVFACGDLARAAGNVALAVGDGALAGAAVHRSLVFGSQGY